jgi:hypothetical protein
MAGWFRVSNGSRDSGRDPKERRSDPVDASGNHDGLAGRQAVDPCLRHLIGRNPHDARQAVLGFLLAEAGRLTEPGVHRSRA